MKLLQMLSITIALALVLHLSGPAAAQKSAADPERLAAARNLMQISGAARAFDTVIPLMMRQIKGLIKKQHSGRGALIDELFTRVEQRFSLRKQELIDQIAALYAREMTTSDMNDIAAFYSSGVGARFIALQPKLMRNSALLGQAWGRKIGQEIVTEVQAELRRRGIAR